MDTKIIVLLLLGVSLLAFGCAGKNAQEPTTIGGGQTAPAVNDTVDDSGDGADENETMDDSEDDAMDDDEIGTNTSASGKDLSGLADLFKVDTDKPLEGEGLDVKTPESNES